MQWILMIFWMVGPLILGVAQKLECEQSQFLHHECYTTGKVQKPYAVKFTATLLLYYAPTCPYSREVLNYLKEKNITIPLCDVTQDMKGKEQLKSYGIPARVPCLVIEGKPLYDSGAIIHWLAENEI